MVMNIKKPGMWIPDYDKVEKQIMGEMIETEPSHAHDNQKFCRDCAYACRMKKGKGKIMKSHKWRCAHPKVVDRRTNFVTGKVRVILGVCSSQRTADWWAQCGEKGKLWERRK